MRLILALFMLLPMSATAVMLDMNGQPRIDPITLDEATHHCKMNGYFIHDRTIYQCVKIRDNVNMAEINEYRNKDAKIQAEKREERAKKFREWLKTDEGKEWLNKERPKAKKSIKLK